MMSLVIPDIMKNSAYTCSETCASLYDVYLRRSKSSELWFSLVQLGGRGERRPDKGGTPVLLTRARNQRASKFSLRRTGRNVRYGKGPETQLYSFLTSTLDGGVVSSRKGSFLPAGKELQCPLYMSNGEPHRRSGNLAKRVSLSSC